MANLADEIEQYILSLMQAAGELNIQRANLASQFRCAPSQISYVIDTRFTPARGYKVESRRGGGGYLRIVKLSAGPDDLTRVLEQQVEDRVDTRTAEHIIGYLAEHDAVTEREALIMLAAVRGIAYPDPRVRDAIRAVMLRKMLLTLAGEE